VKVGDLVRLYRNHDTIGVIISMLQGKGYFDVLRTDGVTIFVHESSLEVISENR
jgi:hypothetical protein